MVRSHSLFHRIHCFLALLFCCACLISGGGTSQVYFVLNFISFFNSFLSLSFFSLSTHLDS